MEPHRVDVSWKTTEVQKREEEGRKKEENREIHRTDDKLDIVGGGLFWLAPAFVFEANYNISNFRPVLKLKRIYPDIVATRLGRAQDVGMISPFPERRTFRVDHFPQVIFS